MKLLTKGYITVFLSLSVTIILSLVLALYQGARISAVRMKTECVADIAMNSVLGEYSRALYEQYGLLMVDSSYGTGNHQISNTKEHLMDYARKNFERSTAGGILNAQTMTAMYCSDVNITGYSVATDGDYKVLERQILAYMASEPVGSLLTDVTSNVACLEENALDSTDVDAMASENQAILDSVEPPVIINDEGEEEVIAIGNPADTVNSQRGIGVLSLASPSYAEISKVVITSGDYASERENHRGTGLSDSEDVSASEKLLLEQYLHEKCGSYGKEKESSLLKYQLEYLIFGEKSDYKNLEKMAETMLFWREASNMMYLFSCGKKVEEAELIATALSIITFMPELAEPLKYSILFAWSFAESISDINILLNGGRVPLMKSDSTWKLGIFDMFNFRSHLNNGDCGEGLYYQDYVKMKLLMTPFDKKIEHLADIIEMDIRQTAGNSGFRLDYCIDIIRAEFLIGTKYGYDTSIERTYGYER